jgi:predicted nicotinamide N-methyase
MVGFSMAWKSSIESVCIIFFLLTKILVVSNSYLLDNKSLVKGRRVLDVGCGCGASSIAAKMAGAINVIANDIDEGNHIFYTIDFVNLSY